MGNYSIVRTRDQVTPDALNNLLISINKQFFEDRINITRNNDSWLLEYKSHDNTILWMDRTYWIEPHEITIDHGGSGGDFGFWIDKKILNECALYFDGSICDEGFSTQSNGIVGRFDTLKDYLHHITKHNSPKIRSIRYKLWIEEMPPEYKDQVTEAWISSCVNNLLD